MEEQTQPTEQPSEVKIDPLHRVFRPVEKKTAKGTIVFKTIDDRLYLRADDGSRRRAFPKTRGKAARAAEKKARRAGARHHNNAEVAMEPGKDPRPDQHPNDGTPGSYPGPPSNSNPSPAPGGVGTGTKNDPADSPAAQPGGGSKK